MNKLAAFIKNFVTGGKTDLNIAISMANRTGIIINDINLIRYLEVSRKTKERFKTLVETHTFNQSKESHNKSAFTQLKMVKDVNQQFDKKIAMMRLAGKDLREALEQKFRKPITEKLMHIFGQ